MTTTKLSRRQMLKLGAGAAAVVAAPALITTRKAYAASDKKLSFWLQPNFNKTADDLLVEQTMEFAKQAGLSDSDVEILKVPGGEIAPKMAAALEVKAPPDVTRVTEQNMVRWMADGHLLDVTDIVEKMRKVEGGINESIMTLPQTDGVYYGAPMGLNPEAAHVRMDKFEEAGYSEFPTTWEAFIEAALKINKPPFYTYGMALGLTPSDSLWETMSVIWAYGGALVDQQGRPAFDSAGSVEGFKLINDMYNNHKISPRGAISWDNAANNKAYQSGQVAYILNPTSVYSSLITDDSKLLAVTGLYSPPGGPAGRHRGLYTDYYSVFRQSQNPDLAKGLIEHFLEPENYSRFIVEAGGRYFPSYPAMVEDPFWTSKPAFADLIETVKDGHTIFWPGTLTPALGEVITQNMVQKELHNVLVEGKDAANAVADVQAQMVETFKRLGEPV
jgi:multiple sugar transport system substrate-binding protein